MSDLESWRPSRVTRFSPHPTHDSARSSGLASRKRGRGGGECVENMVAWLHPLNIKNRGRADTFQETEWAPLQPRPADQHLTRLCGPLT